jgi:hypothetical protein
MDDRGAHGDDRRRRTRQRRPTYLLDNVVERQDAKSGKGCSLAHDMDASQDQSHVTLVLRRVHVLRQRVTFTAFRILSSHHTTQLRALAFRSNW